jgi:hypothetical protein
VAKAYALPLGMARAGSSGSGHSSQLFGAGIEPAAIRPGRRLRELAAPAAYRVLAPGSTSGLEWMAIPAIAVVVLGSAGAGALALRRRR